MKVLNGACTAVLLVACSKQAEQVHTHSDGHPGFELSAEQAMPLTVPVGRKLPYVLHAGSRGSVEREVAEGIVYRSVAIASPAAKAHYVQIDLSKWTQAMRGTHFNHRMRRTSTFATANECLVTINGGFFRGLNTPDACASWGETMSHSQAWPMPTPLRPNDNGFVAIGGEQIVITDPRLPQQPIPSWAATVVAGDPLLVEAGQSRSEFCACPVESPVPETDQCSAQTNGAGVNLGGRSRCARVSRTGIGYRGQTSENPEVVLAVVEGAGEGGGMTLAEFADFFASLGVTRALNLDGGGSSTLHVQGLGVVNAPTDAQGERTVAGHLGVCVGANEDSNVVTTPQGCAQ